MKILSLNQTSCRQTDVVFGASPLRSAAAFFFISSAAATAGYLSIFGRISVIEVPRLYAGLAALFFLLIAWLAGSTWRATRRPTAWVMRVQGNDVLIKYRSFENWPMSNDDPQVISLHRDEIQFVRKADARQVSQGDDKKTVKAVTQLYLEIGLKDCDLSILEKSLADEAALPGWGSDRHRKRYLDVPVEVFEKGIIRIAWKSGAASVRPGIKSALQAMKWTATVEEPRKVVEDFTPGSLRKLGKEEQKKRLLELAGRDRLQAAETARQLYGCSLSEAMQIIEDSIAGEKAQP